LPDDAVPINDIYNWYVLNSHATFDLDPVTIEARGEWLVEHDGAGRHRVFVATHDGTVTGFASSSRYRPRPAYVPSVETSVYVLREHVGRGVARCLYQALLAALEDEDVHRVYAGISMPNSASVALHRRFGFRAVAYCSEQGRKFDRYWDVAWFEKEDARPR
jgi:phosphinothricin acetyltransferase